MAKIIQRASQLEALNEIQADLALIESINLALAQRTGYHIVAVNATGATRARNGATVPVEERSLEKVDALLKAQRERLGKVVRQRAEKFEIALDGRDQDILNGHPPQAKGGTRKARSVDTPEPNEVDVPTTEEGELPPRLPASDDTPATEVEEEPSSLPPTLVERLSGQAVKQLSRDWYDSAEDAEWGGHL